MPVNPPRLSPPLPVPGFRVGTASCGVKSPALKGKRTDLTIISADVDCHAAGAFTRNRFRAACVDLGEHAINEHGTAIRGIIANSGNANAGTGIKEEAWARAMIESASAATGINPDCMLSASTGVIGTPFPIECIQAGMSEAVGSLSADHWQGAAEAIRTTDTFAKWASTTAGEYTITGIAKGSGMIHPDMATMLSFIATDAPLTQAQLQAMLSAAVKQSFNAISVDGDTSTNDTVYLLSSGLGLGHAQLEDTAEFADALTSLCIELAQMIVRDGEGVSKFVTIHISGAANSDQARHIGRTIAISPLVKTAFAGSDANWGRIIGAAGNSGIEFDPDQVSLKADDIIMLKGGELHPDYRDEDGMAVFARDEFTITMDLGMGTACATIWTGDLTHDYITINAEYRT